MKIIKKKHKIISIFQKGHIVIIIKDFALYIGYIKCEAVPNWDRFIYQNARYII